MTHLLTWSHRVAVAVLACYAVVRLAHGEVLAAVGVLYLASHLDRAVEEWTARAGGGR